MLALAVSASAAQPASAIDNPDAPDAVAEFERRAKPLEERWATEAGGPGQAAAAQAYARFLDDELNRAYQSLLALLPGEARRALIRSQRQWLSFRDAERGFIDRHFTPQAFGSSASLSRADFHHQLVRQRVLTLLAHLKNHPAPTR